MLAKYSKYFFVFGGVFIGGFLVWMYMRPLAVHKQDCSQKYSFISSEIDCQSIDEKVNQVEDLRKTIAKIVDDEKEAHHIMRASVFYRDLNTRRWFGVNDTDAFYPASLIKLPLAIMYYKVAELEPYILDKELAIPANMGDNSDQHYPPVEPLLPGKIYTVREMIRHMLMYSDNAPFSTLYEGGSLFRDKILSDLSIYSPPVEKKEEVWNVTARSYANIFRMLYNASYVSVASANEILDLLSQSTFQNGIVKGVPKSVAVAHKFGEVEWTQGDGVVQSRILNDCGIVYKPEEPYILCVMTEGQDYAQMEKVIQAIAKASYNAL